MKFEDCYPVEIVEWAQALPEPEQCTPQETEIHRLLDNESVIAIGQALIQRLNNAATREEAAQMTTFFRGLIQDAAYMRQQARTGLVMTLDEMDDAPDCLIIPTDHRCTLNAMNWVEDFEVEERRANAKDPSAAENEKEISEDDTADIAAICTALNVYYWGGKNTNKLLEQSRIAPKLLSDTVNTIDKLVSLLNITEKNAYVSTAIFATLDQDDIDQQIAEFCEKTEKICELLEQIRGGYTKAASQKEYSDALPEPKKGRPQDAHFDELIAKLSKHISRIGRRVEGSNYLAADIAGVIAEILRETDIRTIEKKSIENSLSELGGYQGWLAIQVEKQGPTLE